ncbi:hypothetical protein [Paraburkholderia caffeinilytica]|uniref:hypothetical protein n=1 Tax=Paraburkholderia caffeinilytica TaxID=1761016 RepID=UPI0013BE8D53|nr:hypothetical protein [Paraburkholderia caffeinilytica]
MPRSILHAGDGVAPRPPAVASHRAHVAADICMARDGRTETGSDFEIHNNCYDIHPVLSVKRLFDVGTSRPKAVFLQKQGKNTQKPIGFRRFP